MKIIEIEPLPNGGHRNQESTFTKIPNGWALIPEEMAIPDTFPFVDITVEDGIVTEMTAGIVPEPEPEPIPEPEKDTYDEMAVAYMEGVNSI